jgi:hypothetical protein
MTTPEQAENVWDEGSCPPLLILILTEKRNSTSPHGAGGQYLRWPKYFRTPIML